MAGGKGGLLRLVPRAAVCLALQVASLHVAGGPFYRGGMGGGRGDARDASPFAVTHRDASARAGAGVAAAWEVRQSEVVTGVRSLGEVPCSDDYRPFVQGCHPTTCGRYVTDNFVSDADVETLRGIVAKGMAAAPATGGPTIMDINSGFMRGPHGLSRLYPAVSFTEHEYATYAAVFTKIRSQLMASFGADRLWFTAPTFITREVGNASWSPADMHDEYWHQHVDKANTEHYDYSGLLYLSDYRGGGETDVGDFEGGRLEFVDGGDGGDGQLEGDAAAAAHLQRHYVEPRRGRFVFFTSGSENPHRVERVTAGTRFVFSMWYTCDADREFKTFMDGKVHNRFGEAGAGAGGTSGDSGKAQAQPRKRRKRRRKPAAVVRRARTPRQRSQPQSIKPADSSQKRAATSETQAATSGEL